MDERPDEKPLHVRVAEALAQRYATDLAADGWAATGPLIEKYGISLGKGGTSWHANAMPALEMSREWAYGATPLEAVCRLLLALRAAGKLKEK